MTIVHHTAAEAARPRGSAVEVPPRAKPLRTDIQLLRCWAVLSVVVFHAGAILLPGGFLGVDIFFVISGFLMTGLLDDALEDGRFTLRGFYARRARRLLPASYATLLVTAAAAPWLLDTTEMHGFVGQLVGAFTFSENVVLWRQVNYFGTDAALKPLVHVWSLSLEEQYYLILPVLMLLCPTRLRLPLTLGLAAISAALLVAVQALSTSAAFYMLPTRAWELAIGSAVAVAVRRGLVRGSVMTGVRLACAAVLVAVPLLATERGHPGAPALAVCLATAVLMVPGAELPRSHPLVRPFAAIGDRSYSLYLVHWPPLAFAANIFVDAVPAPVTAALLVVAALWTEVQYRFVEQPLRRLAMTPRTVAALVAIPIAAITASAMVASAQSAASDARAGGTGLASACDFRGDFRPIPACVRGPAPRTLVWGDSFAMALAPGMAATVPGGIVQATRTVCGPLIGRAPVNGVLYTRAWGERCLSFNDSVLRFLASRPDLDTVILSSLLTQYIPTESNPGWRALVRSGGRTVEAAQSAAGTAQALASTVARLRAIGKRVVLVTPPPESGLDVARCRERLALGLPTITPARDCSIAVAAYRARRAAVLRWLGEVRDGGVVPVVSPGEWLCDGVRCRTSLGGTGLYRDRGHLSDAGSVALARAMDWGRLVRERAR